MSTVKIDTTTSTVTVTTAPTPNVTVQTSPATAQVVKVVTQGPKGDVGPTGDYPRSGSLPFSGSIDLTGSLVITSGQVLVDGLVLGSDKTSIQDFEEFKESFRIYTGSVDQVSGSVAGRLDTLELFSSSLDSGFVSEQEFAIASGSFLVTGSSAGDTVTLVKGDKTEFSLVVNNVQNSSTASYALTASFLDTYLSPFPFTGSATISGSLNIEGTVSATTFAGLLSSSGQIQAEISGAFTSTSQSIAGDIISLIQDSGSNSVRLSDLELFSSSLDSNFVTETELAIASGSFLTTASISQDTITLTKGSGITFDLTVNNIQNANSASYIDWIGVDNVPAGIVSSSTQLASDISGSFTSVSQSIALDIYGLILDSGSFSTRVTDLENFSSSLDLNYVTENEYNARSSSFAKVNENNTFTGNQTFNNVTINGTGSFAYIQSVTGSAKIIGDAFILLNNDVPAEPFAGIKVINTGSTHITASLIWDGVNRHWIYENVSGSTYGAGGFLAGPRSTDINNILYPTQYKILRSQGGDHVYDSNITDNNTNVSISIPVNVTGDITSSAVIKADGGFQGNLDGNASSATSASYALTASFLDGYIPPFPFTGSAEISGSLDVLGTVVGTSFSGDGTNITGIQSASFAGTAVSSSYALTASFAQTTPVNPVQVYLFNQVFS